MLLIRSGCANPLRAAVLVNSAVHNIPSRQLVHAQEQDSERLMRLRSYVRVDFKHFPEAYTFHNIALNL